MSITQVSVTAPGDGTYIVGDPPEACGWQPGSALRSVSLPPPGIRFPEPPVPTGWVCPHCQTAYSPEVRSCRCSARTPSLAERLHTG